MIQPRTNASDIGGRISALPVDVQSNNIKVASIRRDIEKLKGVNLAEHYMMKGILEAKLRNKKVSIHNFESAINHAWGEPIVNYNYGIALKGFGHLSEAIFQLGKAIEVSFDHDGVDLYIDLCILLGKIEEIYSISEIYYAARPEKRSYLENRIEGVSWLISNLKNLEIDLLDFQHFMSCAESVMTDCSASFVEYAQTFNHFGEMGYLYIEVFLIDSVQSLSLMNDSLLERLVENEVEILDRVVLTFSQAQGEIWQNRLQHERNQ